MGKVARKQQPVGPVVRSLVSANRWLRGIKTYRFPWYLTLVSANHASSKPGQVFSFLFRFGFEISVHSIFKRFVSHARGLPSYHQALCFHKT